VASGEESCKIFGNSRGGEKLWRFKQCRDHLVQFFDLPNWVLSSENFLRWPLEKNLAKFLEIVVLVQTFEHLEI
jgi:hypothetical protein